jgi:alpha-tubulin suppressor-like RCC1 family protein
MLFIEQLLAKSGSISVPKNLLYTWGVNSNGQGGRLTPTRSWTAVAAGVAHTAAIRSDNLLFTWGLNNYGQL